MKILVTGAAGFIGHHVTAALLARGGDVLGVDSLNHYYDPALKSGRLARLQAHDRFTFEKMDLSDPSAVAALQAHPQVAGLQEHGCAALTNACDSTDAAGLARKQRAAAAGAIQAVVAALQAHPQVAGVQEDGCGALANVCSGDDAAGGARSQRAAEAGAIEAAVEGAMLTHEELREFLESWGKGSTSGGGSNPPSWPCPSRTVAASARRQQQPGSTSDERERRGYSQRCVQFASVRTARRSMR